MPPLTFLAAVIGLTAAAFAAHLILRRATADGLRRLAAERGMQYAGRDRFQITPRVLRKFPVPGASDVRVMDVIYRREGPRYRYLFTVEYTCGVVRTKRRVRRAATFCEGADREDWSELVLAEEGEGLCEQYRSLCGMAKECGTPVQII